MSQVMPGIFHLEVPLRIHSLDTISIYVIKNGKECAVIDTGFDTKEGLDSLSSQLQEIGINITDITRIIATHAHGDHYGMAGTLKKLSNATITLHRLEKEFNDRMMHSPQSPEKMDQWFRSNGAPPFGESERRGYGPFRHRFAPPTPPDIVLQGDEVITIGDNHLKVIWTPGHAPGHIVLYEPDKKLLISGDCVLPTITPNVSARLDGGDDNPLGSFVQSLKNTRKLDARMVLPAHGKPFQGLQKRVDEIIEHHEKRNREILAAARERPMTAYVAAGKVTWMESVGGRTFEQLGPIDRRLAILETLSHIEYLRHDGRLNKTVNDDGVIYYSVT